MPSYTVYKGDKSGVPKAATTTRPDELKGDQVYVRITASGLCGTGMYDLTMPVLFKSLICVH